MSIVSRVLCSAVAAGVILSISVPSYAVTSSSETVTLVCPVKSYEPTELIRPQEPKTQYSVTLNGFHADGYSLDLITKMIGDFDGGELLKMKESDKKILCKITPNVEATCSSGKKKINKQMLVLMLGSPEKATLTCSKGEGLLVEMYDPTNDCAKNAEFTITTTSDDDEKIIKEVFEIKKNVTEGTFSKSDLQVESQNPKVPVTKKSGGGCFIL